MFVTNGGVASDINGAVGYSATSGSNKVFVAGPGSVWQNRGYLYIGFSGKGNQLVISNAGTVTASMLQIGVSAFNSSNQLVVAGGTLLVTNTLTVYNGTLTLNSGRINAATLSLSAAGVASATFNGGTLQTRMTTAPVGPFVIGNGTNAAIFEMLATGTHSFSGGLAVRSNATLKGVGTILGNVTNQNGGTLSPGSSIGQISMNADLVFNAGSTNIMDLNANTGASDTIVGMMNVTYRGTLQLSNLAGVLANGNSFTLFSATNYFGAFDSVLPHSPGPNLRWNLDRLTIDGVLQVVAKTPSPPPLISGTTLSAGNLVITGGNGVPYDPCVLWSSTNLAADVWTPWVTNYFDASGNVIFTNPILPGEPVRFFRLQVE
jgi:T5SS/PEP-CTERM-associated repeat protein